MYDCYKIIKIQVKIFTIILWVSIFFYKKKVIKVKSNDNYYHNNKKVKFNNFINEKKFINNCLKLKLVNHNYFIKATKILISAIVPVYNSEKTIISSVRSIENQNISQIEILLVNDFSSDNSLKLIKNLQNNDPRIIIINNKKNMGTLYSRSIGALKSRGKYIFSLDNDDLFFNDDVFDTVYKNAKFGNYDIVKFEKYYIFFQIHKQIFKRY